MVGGVTGKAGSRINRYISWKQNSLLLRIIFVYRIEAKQFFFYNFYAHQNTNRQMYTKEF